MARLLSKIVSLNLKESTIDPSLMATHAHTHTNTLTYTSTHTLMHKERDRETMIFLSLEFFGFGFKLEEKPLLGRKLVDKSSNCLEISAL